jgi:hypothetical protein
MNVSSYPHEAIVTPISKDSVHRAFAFCSICKQRPDNLYQVNIPVKWIDDERMQVCNTEVLCCSQEHVLEYLQNAKLVIVDKDRRLPSETIERGWIAVFRKYGTYPDNHPLRDGKWMVWFPPSDIDRYWKRIRVAVEQGLLGNWAKVSTAGSISEKRPDHVICVYTYDYEDKEDVMRIREVLQKIGIRQRIPYKANEDTHKLLYGCNYAPKYRA